MVSDRKRWLPHLYYDHPGYFKVVASLVLIHLGLALDSLQDGPHHSPIFRVLIKVLSNQLYLLTVVHGITAVLLVVGLYWRGWFSLVRYGCAISLILFNAIAVAFAASAYIYNLSYYSAIASVTLSLSSLAALKEPPVQAASRGDESWQQ